MEKRVYGIDSNKLDNPFEFLSLQDLAITDERFIELAEEHGFVWSLNGFSLSYNIDDIPNSVYIRIL